MEMEYAGEERRNYPDGHSTPCPYVVEHTTDEKELHDDLKALLEGQKKLLENQEAILEIVTAWNEMKGFIRTMIRISSFMKWLVAFGVSIAAVWYFIIRR